MACIRSFFVAASCALALSLTACGGGGGGSAEVPPPPAVHPLSGVYSTGQALLTIDAEGYAAGWSFAGDVTTGEISFAGTVLLGADGAWRIDPAQFAATTGGATSTTTTAITGTTTDTGSLTFTIPRPPLPPMFAATVTAGRLPGLATSLAQAAGVYRGGLGSEFVVSSAGEIRGRFVAGCDMQGTVHDAPEVFPIFVTLSGAGCPAGLAGAARMLGHVYQDAGTISSFSLQAFSGLRWISVSAARVTVPGASIPDGTVSPLPLYADPAQPALLPLAGRYMTPGVAPVASADVLVDASGRFLMTALQSSDGSTPYGEDILIGTLVPSGGAWVSSDALILHRDTGTSPWRSSTATATLSFTVGLPPTQAQLTLAAGSLVPVASTYALEFRQVGFQYGPFAVPHGGYFNNSAVVIDGTTGRVRGAMAEGCAIEGAMSVTAHTVNVFRLRARLQGPGCAAANLPEGEGEFLGAEWLGARSWMHSWDFRGVIGGQRVNLGFARGLW